MPIIRVELIAGRNEEQKRAFAAAATREAVAILRCRPEDVDVIFSEVAREDWWNRGHPPEPAS